MRTFVRSVAIITIFTAVTRALGFVFRIFLSRILGAEMLGVYQISMSFFSVFLTLVASGLPLAISKQVAASNRSGIAVAGLVISLVTSIAACTVVFAAKSMFGMLFTDGRCVAILIALIPSLIAASIYTVTRAVWWGEKRFFLLGITELMEQIVRIVTFAIMAAFAFLFVDMAQIAAISYTVAFFIAAVVCLFFFVKLRRLGTTEPREKRSQYRTLLSTSTPITLVRVITNVTMPIISILIPYRLVAYGYDPTTAIAAYGILVGMTLPMLTIPQTIVSSLATALVPELGRDFANKNVTAMSAQIKNALKFTLFINFLLLPAFMSVGKGIGLLVFNNSLSGLYLVQFAWAMVPMSLSQITNAILNSIGAETRAMKHYFIGAVFLFGSVWFLTPTIGIGALVLGIGLCMTIASVLNLCLITKLTGHAAMNTCIRQILIFSVICIPTGVLGYFTFGILTMLLPIGNFGLFVSLCLSGAATILTFVALCHLFNAARYLKIAFLE